MSLRILTFNWHESYIHLLAKTGHDFDVVEKEKAGIYGWIRAIRPVPPNCRIVTEADATAKLDAGAYDRIIAHNLGDLLSVGKYETPKVLVFHNKLSTEIVLSKDPVDKTEYLARVSQVFDYTRNLTLVFISESKMRDWGFQGEIILPGIDPEDYGGYAGQEAKVLQIGNGLKERDVMLGYSIQERVTRGLPSTILGINALIPHAYVPSDWDEYRGLLQAHRVYLNTTTEPYEDGYNLAMLEAMATGMPVVSTENSSSPVEDGSNGYVSSDETQLRTRLETLLRDRSRAESMGSRARESVLDRFPIRRFTDRWNAVLQDRRIHRVSTAKREVPGRRRILMSYTSNPQTTGMYLEKALRRQHEVVTYGPCIDDEILRLWNMEELRDRVREHDIPYFTKDLEEVLAHLGTNWVPDLFLWVESGIYYPIDGMESLPCPTACYLVDSHLNLETHLEMAKRFDCVFVAQKEYIPRFRQEGIEEVHWLPLACDPEVHGKARQDKEYDVAFVGSITPANHRRNAQLWRLAGRFSLHVDRCFLEKMASTFDRARIVFNQSVKNDLNMRVFEAMSTGSLLVTDEAGSSGLTDLFEDRGHLVLYRNDAELFSRIEHYLAHPSEREKIAARGRREVLAKHTYEHRTMHLVEVIGRMEQKGCRSKGISHMECSGNAVQTNSTEPPQEDRRTEITPVLLDTATGAESPLSNYYKQERRELVALVPEEAEKILDIGCGGGHMGRLLKNGSKHREVWGVEIQPDAYEEAKKWLDHVVLADARDWEPPLEKGCFDVLVFADVLEHLRNPEAALEHYLPWLKPTGSVVMSIPNVRFWGVVQHLANGRWTYQDEGLLDRDHVRFFTWAEINRLLASCGLMCREVRPNLDGRCPEVPEGKTTDLRLGRVTIHDLGPEEVKEFFVFQYFVRAERTKEHLLTEAERLEATGRHSEAFRLYAHLLGRNGTDTKAAAKLAELGRTPKEKEEAFTLIDDCLSTHPANTELLIATARLLVGQERFSEAKQRLERVLLFLPDHKEARDHLDGLSCC